MQSNLNNRRMLSPRNMGALIAFLLIAVCLIAACSKMDYTYKKFLKDGSIIYPGRADSVRVYPGHSRIKLTWLITSDPTIVLSRVYWNDRADSVEVPIERGHGTDTISVIIDSLDEGYYNFEIYTYDKEGNTSVAADTIGQVFGPVYAASLHNRIIKKLYWDEDTAYIFWYKPAEGAVDMKLDYKDATGAPHTMMVGNTDTATLLPNFRLHDAFDYQTGYMPDSMAIDTFYVAYSHVAVDDTLAVVLPPFPSPDGEYTLINKLSGKAVSVENAGTGNNANIIQAAFTGAGSQLWKFVDAPTAGYYELDNVNSGSPYAIAVSSASTADGAKLVQYKFGKGGNDQWKPEKVDGPYYKLICQKSDKVMEIKDNSTDDNATVQQGTWNGGDNQQFKLIWNLGLGAEIKGSSGGSHPASDMFDGNDETYWQPNSGDRQDDEMVWVQVDFGEPRVFDELDQFWKKGNNHIGSYKILYSNDGNTWKTAFDSKDKGPDSGENEAAFPPVKGRYARLELNFAEDGNVNITEVKIYYTPR